ncbi:MAG: PilW family protein [Burkholderiaceae bacterium]
MPRRTEWQRGVTLVELMVGMLIGLLAVIVISQIMLVAEGQKRTTTGGSDAQVNGALALYSITRDLEMAGYGLTSSPGVVGCPISARFNGAAPARFPANLVPVVVTAEAARVAAGEVNAVGDSIRIIASSKSSYSVPTRVIPPAYAAGGQAFPVTASMGIAQSDLALVGIDGTQPCWVFQATGVPTGQSVPRVDDAARWNTPGMPNLTYADGSVLINLGTLVDSSYGIVGTSLQQQSFDITSPGVLPPSRDVQPDIVNMRALYGKDTNGDGVVDVYDSVTPTTNATWLQVIAIRVVVVARSDQFEKEDVTPANLQWDVGTTPATTGAVACGTSTCLTINVNHLTDWKRYRYKLFETVVPLRNMVWRS